MFVNRVSFHYENVPRDARTLFIGGSSENSQIRHELVKFCPAKAAKIIIYQKFCVS